jgi:hypothetical protein
MANPSAKKLCQKTADDDLFEDWYILNVFDYEKNPVGSRECGLQRKAWMAAKEVYQDKINDNS